jgi:D-ribose pyranase
MIKTGILNPQILSLIARVRHTNLLVIADRGFPFWPMIETVDISLVDDVPTVLQVFTVLQAGCQFGQVYMAEEFLAANTPEVHNRFAAAAAGVPFLYEPHVDLKKRVPGAIGLIRTGDTTQYANMILVSA